MASPLAQELSLPCGAVIPNRIGKSAMTEGLADENDNPTDDLIRLYGRWADGGTGLVISGNVMVDRRYLERAGNIVLEDDQAMTMLQHWAKQGTRAGNHLWLQLSHPGRQCPRMVNGEPLSPSEVHLDLLGNFGRPRAMTEADIEDAIQRFATSAALAKQAGFTGVQIHCAHGYLVSQFLSPQINQRIDDWGGTLENRARFARRIVRAVRETVGPDFPVAAKLNSSDFQQGGFTLEDCVTVAGWLAEDSLDLLEISGGSYEQQSMMGVEASDVRESTRRREAYFVEYAKAIRESAKIPLMITGGFRSRDAMESSVKNDGVDVVGLARPLCTQPDVSKRLISQTIGAVDNYESDLVLGTGFWGHNSPSNLVKGINSFGPLGFYCEQIILLGKGLEPNTQLGVFKAFLKHMYNDLKLNLRRKKAAKRKNK